MKSPVSHVLTKLDPNATDKFLCAASETEEKISVLKRIRWFMDCEPCCCKADSCFCSVAHSSSCAGNAACSVIRNGDSPLLEYVPCKVQPDGSILFSSCDPLYLIKLPSHSTDCCNVVRTETYVGAAEHGYKQPKFFLSFRFIGQYTISGVVHQFVLADGCVLLKNELPSSEVIKEDFITPCNIFFDKKKGISTHFLKGSFDSIGVGVLAVWEENNTYKNSVGVNCPLLSDIVSFLNFLIYRSMYSFLFLIFTMFILL